MDAGDTARTIKAWRDRQAGRVAFDLSAAEATVREAYRASALPEPNQILWARGPREAAQAVAFIETPPRRLRRVALMVLGLGAAAWGGFALAFDGSALALQPPATTAIVSVILAGFGVALGGMTRLPVLPGLPAGRFDAKAILWGSAVFAVLAGYLFVVQRLGGLPNNPLGRGAALALAAAIGALPGVFLFCRIRRLYADLPRSLREFAPSASVVSRFESARWEAWAPFRRTASGLRPDESLRQAYRSAHREAFARRRTSWQGFDWTAGDVSRDPRFEVIREPPPHLDGIEDAVRAAAVAQDGGTGAAASFADLAFRIDRLYPFATIAVAVRPPSAVALDAEGRPHAEEGPALAWADGTHIFAWHGRLVPPEVLDRTRPLTRSRIDREADPERRWVLIERYGLGRYLLESGAAEIQRDECGGLYRLSWPLSRLSWPLSEPIQAVRVVNHTPEPDGRLREFWLCVPPMMRTAREAVAWTFGLEAEAYDPIAQS